VRTRRSGLEVRIAPLALVWTLGLTAACQGVLDAGHDLERAALPVGPKNPVVLVNDGPRDNWQGEYAVLLSERGGAPLVGIVVIAGGQWFDLDANLTGWQELVTAARASGLTGVPDLTRSASQPLGRPTDDDIESTVPNDSDGARFIVETSRRLATPELPLVVATGCRLTEVADAYLIDPTVVDRVVVVASLGTGFSNGESIGRMGVPNGEMDPWANAIVARKFRYVQVSAYYEQTFDLPTERLDELPDNPLGNWMREKQPDILGTELASDQISVLAVGFPPFVRRVARLSAGAWEDEVLTLTPDEGGQVWLVTESDGAAATARLWELLKDPGTFGPG
jgi:hypothetical protein